MSYELKNKYHFDKIFELSKTKVKEELKYEWRFLFKEESDSKDKLCICQHKIKYSYVYVNLLTGNIIRVGSTCRKNLELKYPKIDDDLIKCLNGDVGEYGIIGDALVLSEDLRKVVIDHYQKKYWGETNVENLRFVVRKIEELISIYRKKQIDTTKLLDLLEKINSKIIRLIKEKIALEETRKREREEEIERERRRVEEHERLLKKSEEGKRGTLEEFRRWVKENEEKFKENKRMKDERIRIRIADEMSKTKETGPTEEDVARWKKYEEQANAYEKICQELIKITSKNI